MSASRNPEISIILPCHNSSATLAGAVASVQAQTLGDFELLIVDDASTDGTLALARELAAGDPRLRILALDRNQGVGGARNRGLDAVRGRYVAFLDSDDEYLPDFLTRLHGAADGEQGTIAVCGHLVAAPDGAEAPRARAAGLLDGPQAVREAMLGRLSLFPWDKLVPRALLEGLRYPEGPPRFEDLAMLLPLFGRASRVRVVADPLVRYRITRAGLTWTAEGSEADFEAARSHLDSHLPHRYRSGSFAGPYAAVLTLMRLLSAQTASVSGDRPAARARTRELGRRLPWLTPLHAGTAAPVIGLAGLALKAAPQAYAAAYRRYAANRYGIGALSSRDG